jgi:dienelactone hydrolase
VRRSSIVSLLSIDIIVQENINFADDCTFCKPATMLIQSKACCTNPPVTLAGGYDYELRGNYVQYNGLKTCEINCSTRICLPTVPNPTVSFSGRRSINASGSVALLTRNADETGSPAAKRGIFLCYDVFGLYIQALRGADILAFGYAPTPDGSGDFKVFMPDFWGDHPQDMANFPPKTPKQTKAIVDFMTGPAAPERMLPLIRPLLEDMKKRNPAIETWAIMGFCWGGKVAALESQSGTPFKVAAQCHPSLLEVEDANQVTMPMVVLPSI